MSGSVKDIVKVGIVGLGGIATRMHIPALASIEGVEVVAGAEINPQQAERTQRRFGIPRIYSDFDEMLSVEKLHAVYVCLPSFLHYRVVKTALEKGLHVYCEKPMGLSADQAHTLVQEAERNELVLVPGYQLRFNKNYLRGKQIIQDRRLGKILHLQGMYINPGPYAGWDPKSDWYYDARGYGVLYDLGCHVLDLLFMLCSPDITEVYARSTVSLPGLPVPDCVVVLLATDTQTLGSLNIGWSTGATFDSIQVHGSGGSMVVSSQYFEYIPPEAGGFHRLETLWDNATQVFQSKAGAFVKKQSRSEGTEISRSFIEAVAGRANGLSNAHSAVRVLEVLDAIKASLASGKPIAVQRHTRTVQ
jgi:predicted dehydrogenase